MKPTAILFGYLPLSLLEALSSLILVQQRDELPAGACPDICILGLDLEFLNGVELSRRLTQECPSAKVVAITGRNHLAKYQNQLKRAGVVGYCLRESGAERS